MTTACTICGMPTPGADNDDSAWCPWCFAQHVVWSGDRPLGELRLPPPRIREAARRRERVWVREDGRETSGRERQDTA